ncbi:MAG TPA: hypothetical protein VLZ83_07780 [Edaphocola sp.]|nr:hypothetical protein [Edaphocola sp.]
MKKTLRDIIVQHIESQRAVFATNKPKDINFRLAQLRKLKKAIQKNKKKLEEALLEDLHKSPEEACLTETSIVTGEIDNPIKHLKKLAKSTWIDLPLKYAPFKYLKWIKKLVKLGITSADKTHLKRTFLAKIFNDAFHPYILKTTCRQTRTYHII